jgi:AcrR family transcriptional regulator
MGQRPMGGTGKSRTDGRKENAAATQAALRRAGWMLFGRDGFDKTSVTALCAEAGVTTGALYHHFGDKTGLFATVAEDLDRALVTRCREAIAKAQGQGGSLWDGLMASVDMFLAAGLDPAGRRIGLVDATAVLGGERWLEIRERHGLGAMTALVGELQAASLMQPGDPKQLARLILGLLYGAVESLPPDPAAARQALSETARTVKAMLAGLKAAG